MTTPRRRPRPLLAAVLALAVLSPTQAFAAVAADPGDPRGSHDDRSATSLPVANPVTVLPETPARVAVTRKVGGKLKVQSYPAASKAAAKRLVSSLADDAGVVAAALDTPTRALGDPHRGLQQGLDQLEAEAARKVNTGAGVTLAVLDTGVEGTHPDLAANLRPGAEFLDGTGVSSGNGWTDQNGHGTHVAGIAAAALNGIGVEGLAPDLAILPVRVLDQNGAGHNSDVAAGIVWAADHGADVINLSLGSPTPDPNLQATIDYATARGVVVVAAAGDSWFQGNPTIYPAAYDDVIAVAATDPYLGRAGFSESGDWIDVTAPGEMIASTYIGNSYEYMDGTSMAASFVAASAAMLLGAQPGLTPAQVKERLELTATDLGPLGFDPDFGNGLVSPLRAMTQALVPAPRLVGVTAGDHTLSIEWAANPENTQPVLEHHIRVSTPGEPAHVYTAPADGTSYFVGDLTNGHTYSVSVAAVTANGTSRSSAVLSATPQALRTPLAPAAPLLTGVEAGDRSATLTWDAPPSSGTAPLSAYELTATSPDAPSVTVTAAAGALTAKMSPLENGAEYTFTITATSADGTSPVSNTRTATPARPKVAPSAPDLAAVTAAEGALDLFWGAPDSEGTAPVSSYEAIATSEGSAPVTTRFGADAHSGRIPGLSPGVQYTVLLRAVSADGTSADSGYRTATPTRVKVAPGAPKVLELLAGDGSITATWAPPETSGSAPVSTYELTAAAPSAPTVSIDFLSGARTGTLTGLRNDVTYTVTMRTHTADGASAYATPRDIIPFRTILAPSAPTLTDVTPGDTTIALAWTAPTTEGTAPVTSYGVRATSAGFDPIVVTLPSSARSTTLTGLRNETEYIVTVRAISADGTSPTSTPRAVTAGRLKIAPSAPELTAATAGNAVIDLTWTAPTAEGTAPVDGYEVTATSATAPTVSKTLPVTARATTLTGLVNGATYTVRVRATSADGPSSPATRDLTPNRPMWAPSAPSLEALTGNTLVNAYWGPPETPGSSPVTGYEVRISSAAGTRTQTFGADTYRATLSNLTNWTEYTIAVRALTDDANSAFSVPVVLTPRTPKINPSAVTVTTAAAGDGTVTALWTAPTSTGSAPISSYEMYVQAGTAWQRVILPESSRRGTITGLTNGVDYSVWVWANTADGWSTSNVLHATPQRTLVPPGYPTITSVTPRAGGVTFDWTPPGNTGSAPITEYFWGLTTPRSTPGAYSFYGTTAATARSVTLNNLDGNTVYTLTVRAVSADGTGSYGFSSTFTTLAVPPPPPPPAPAIALNVSVPSPATGVVTINSGFTSALGGKTEGVAFRVDGVLLGTDTTAPYTWPLDTRKYTNGSHVVHVQATTTQDRKVVVSGKSFTFSNVTLTLDAPTSVTYNTNATFTGQIGGTTALSNQRVTLERESNGTWSDVTTLTSNTSGVVKYTAKLLRGYTYRLKLGTSESARRIVSIEPVLNASHTRVVSVYFKGTLTPDQGQKVLLQILDNGTWRTTDTATVASNGTFTGLVAALPRGSSRWRLFVAASGGYTSVTSSYYFTR